ncbi:MAG: bifunctional oligoribonuclease/PAP phosphatase NrnA [Syntrophotaleaceae bacterium]
MIQAILRTIEQGKRFLVASHGNPDGDALGSTIALTLALREMGKEAVAYNQDGISEEMAFLPGADSMVKRLEDGDQFDAGFILDSGELARAGSHLRECCDQLVNVDHHPYSEDFGTIYYVDESACATGALVYRILTEAGHPISSQVAVCIYAAILADTGSFRYSNANPEAFQIAAEMVGKGVSPWDVASNLYENRPEKRMRLLAKALQTLTVSPCGRYGSISVTSEMFDATGADSEHTDGFINYPRSIRDVEVAIFFRQVGSQSFKIGFRSKGRVDVGSIAREFGGGGHHNASGATLPGSLKEVQETVFSRLDSLTF